MQGEYQQRKQRQTIFSSCFGVLAAIVCCCRLIQNAYQAKSDPFLALRVLCSEAKLPMPCSLLREAVLANWGL